MSNNGRTYSPRATQNIPSVHGVKDADARQALEVLITGWRVRNGETASPDRFITKAELDTLRREMLQYAAPENRNNVPFGRTSTSGGGASGSGGGGGGVVVGGGGGGSPAPAPAVDLLPLNNSWTGTNSFAASASFSGGIDVDMQGATTFAADITAVVADAWAMPSLVDAISAANIANGFGARNDLVGVEASIVNMRGDLGSYRRAGLATVFKDRTGAALDPLTISTGTKAGLSDLTWPGTSLPAGFQNQLNWNATGLLIDSQDRSLNGEYSGWQRGIYFSPTSLDMSRIAYRHHTLTGETALQYSYTNKAIGIDMTAIAGWPAPTRLGRIAAGIALPPDVGVSFSNDYTSQLLGTYDSFADANVVGLYKSFIFGVSEEASVHNLRMAVNMGNGDLYLNAEDTGTRRPQVYVNQRRAALFDTDMGNEATAVWAADAAGLTVYNTDATNPIAPDLILKSDAWPGLGGLLTEYGSMIRFVARNATGAFIDYATVLALMTDASAPYSSLVRFGVYSAAGAEWIDFDGAQRALAPSVADGWDLGTLVNRFKVARAAKVETDEVVIVGTAAHCITVPDSHRDTGTHSTPYGFLPIMVGAVECFLPLYQ